MRASTVDRRTRILDALSKQGYVNIAELRQEHGCSEATLRRDLSYLSAQGLVRRTFGGAASYAAAELPFNSRVGAMADEKQRIATRAAAIVSDGQAIGLTGGTTTQQVARALASKDDLTILTNAMTVAMEFATSSCRVLLTGGELRLKTYEMVGPLADHTASQIHLDIVFVGVDGLSVDGGLTTHNPMEARINQVLMENSDKVIVVSDHTKLGKKTLARVAPATAANMIITDAGAYDESIAGLQQLGIQVIRT